MVIENKNKIPSTLLQYIKNVAAGQVLALWAFVGVAPCCAMQKP